MGDIACLAVWVATLVWSWRPPNRLLLEAWQLESRAKLLLGSFANVIGAQLLLLILGYLRFLTRGLQERSPILRHVEYYIVVSWAIMLSQAGYTLMFAESHVEPLASWCYAASVVFLVSANTLSIVQPW